MFLVDTEIFCFVGIGCLLINIRILLPSQELFTSICTTILVSCNPTVHENLWCVTIFFGVYTTRFLGRFLIWIVLVQFPCFSYFFAGWTRTTISGGKTRIPKARPRFGQPFFFATVPEASLEAPERDASSRDPGHWFGGMEVFQGNSWQTMEIVQQQKHPSSIHIYHGCWDLKLNTAAFLRKHVVLFSTEQPSHAEASWTSFGILRRKGKAKGPFGPHCWNSTGDPQNPM